MRDVHGETEGSISCLEENCDFKCHYIKQLRVHLSTAHSLNMRVEGKCFKCEEGQLATLPSRQVHTLGTTDNTRYSTLYYTLLQILRNGSMPMKTSKGLCL